MVKVKSIPPLSDVYRKAWESCQALWPLFILRFVFVILNFGAILLCLFLVCWPFIKPLIDGFEQSGANFIPNSTLLFENYAQDLGWLAMAVGLILLFITWWGLLAALFDGAVYSQMREHQENGRLFSLGDFFKDGARYLMPMIGLQVLWSLLFFGVMMIGFLGGILAALLLKILSMLWLGILLGIPLFFLAVVVMIGLAGWGILAGAYLMDRKGVMHAMRQGYQKCLEGHGRAIWGILLLWVIYFVFSIAFQVVMSIFGLIPLIGLLFIIAQWAGSLFLSVAIWVYMPALAVAFSLEKEN